MCQKCNNYIINALTYIFSNNKQEIIILTIKIKIILNYRAHPKTGKLYIQFLQML